MGANDFSFFAIPWVEKWRNHFHTSRFFSKEQLGKCWCGVSIHFSYNAINYTKTQLSHSFKILKYFSAKTQKDICGIPQSLSEKQHARTSHLGSTRQELNKGDAQLVREPRRLSGQTPSASSGHRDANGMVCRHPAPEKGFKPGGTSRKFPWEPTPVSFPLGIFSCPPDELTCVMDRKICVPMNSITIAVAQRHKWKKSTEV